MIRVLDDISSKVEQGGPPEQKGLDDERESGVEIVLIDEKEPEDIVPAHGERQAEPPVMQEKKPSTYHRPKIADSQEGLKKRPVKQLKILIVEDEFSARQILISFLSEYGECHIAKDGIEGINAFVNSYEEDPPQPYNLICMDIKMPQMDGTQATRTIREIERGKGVEGTDQETTIIIASATDDPKTIIKACYECGANYYFVKPLSKKQIVRQMKKLALL